MGTTKTGRLINTYGSARIASEFSIIHSNEGTFRRSGKKDKHLRLYSGGHGQDGMELLDKYGIRYKVEKTYQNGVRVGYVIDHVKKAKRQSGAQSWFPKNWTSKDIKHAGEHVAGLKKNRHTPDGKKMYGTWKGVKVVVVKTHGKIASIFPDSKQPINKRGPKKDNGGPKGNSLGSGKRSNKKPKKGRKKKGEKR